MVLTRGLRRKLITEFFASSPDCSNNERDIEAANGGGEPVGIGERESV